MKKLTPKRIGVEKYLDSVKSERTYAHSTTPCSPRRARINETAKRAPAMAIDNVADPAPALAFTTSVPASYGSIMMRDLNIDLIS